jgi:hypothetical protein
MNFRIAGLIGLLAALVSTQAFAQASMIYGTDAVNTPPTVSLPQPSERYFTNGNGTTVAATQLPDYWANKVGGELSSAIQGACGLTLNMSNYGQLNACIASIQSLIAGQHGKLLGVAVFNSSGSFTPIAGAVTFEVEMISAGGGGGGAAATDSGHISVGSGGGAGGYIHFITTASLTGATVTVGNGGAGGTAGNPGGAGGVTNLGGIANCAATGTAGSETVTSGVVNQVGQGQSSGGCSASGQVISAGGGQPGLNGLLLNYAVSSGQGAPSPFGGGSGNTNNGAGGNATTPGAGGSGAGCPPSCPGYSGGNGAAGLVIIRQYS